MTDNPTTHPNPQPAASTGAADRDEARGPQVAPQPIDRRRVPRNGRVDLIRDPSALAGQSFDLVVVGGGAFGAWAAYDAAQRGLSVALIERNDFGSGTSADALRGAHAQTPTRTLAPAALRRAAAERCVLMRVAPHLVRPLALLTPRYGGGVGSVLRMALALATRTVAAAGVGRGLHDPDRRDRWGSVLTAVRLRAMLPNLPRHRLAGGERMPRLQIVCPERLVLAVVQSAVCRGAKVLNHAEVDGLIFGKKSEGDVVTGVTVSDRHTGETFSVHAHAVLNASGPDAGDLLLRGNRPIELPATAGRDELLLLTGRRLVTSGGALALPAGPDRPDGSELFVAPLENGGSLLGPWPLADEEASTRAAAVEACLAAANRAYPVWRLRPQDVRCVSTSRVPVAEPGDRPAEVIDHAERDGVSGLFSLMGRRYASAHAGAAHAVDLVVEALGLPEIASRTTRVPLVGGDMVSVAAAADELSRDAGNTLDRLVLDGLLDRHGSHARTMARAAIDAGTADGVADTAVLIAELVHAAESESAVTLADAVLRRTGLACWGDLGDSALADAAEAMSAARGWSDAERVEQISRVRVVVADHTLSGLASLPDEPHPGPQEGDAA